MVASTSRRLSTRSQYVLPRSLEARCPRRNFTGADPLIAGGNIRPATLRALRARHFTALTTRLAPVGRGFAAAGGAAEEAPAPEVEAAGGTPAAATCAAAG